MATAPPESTDRTAADALIVVDVQNDFCEGGALGVTGGTAAARSISTLIPRYRTVVATRDHHVDPGDHFSDTPDFVDSWPPHCRAGTEGAEFSPALETDAIATSFDKGAYSAAYSGFEGNNSDGATLDDWLRERGVGSVDVVGIATDHCVRATALDAAKAGFTVRVLLEHTAAVDPTGIDRVTEELRAAGVTVVGELPGSSGPSDRA